MASETTVTAPSSTVVLLNPTPTITPCQSRCREQATSSTDCTTLDCVCHDTNWLDAGLVCTVANCSAHEASGFLDQFNVLCGLASDLPVDTAAPTIPGSALSTGQALPGSALPASAFALPGTALADSAASVSLPGSSLSVSRVQGRPSATSTGPASSNVASASSSNNGPSTAVIAGLSAALGVVFLAAASACFYAWRRFKRDRAFHLNRKNASDLAPFDDHYDGESRKGIQAFEIVSTNGPMPVAVGGILSFDPARGTSSFPPSKGSRPAAPTADARSTVAEDGSVVQYGTPSSDQAAAGGRPQLQARSNPEVQKPPSSSHSVEHASASGTRSFDLQAGEVRASSGGRNTHDRDRVLVVPWSLGQRLLAMAGSAPAPQGESSGMESDDPSEPPPAYEPQGRQRRKSSAPRSARTSGEFRTV
ncbi:hypothetical protein BV20DRAFT_973808 [Pilatotrama ljubarskyi]|nr:hypothetical protein BV20DRAFT_973808 [Pilatotrama ljubarskyi]